MNYGMEREYLIGLRLLKSYYKYKLKNKGDKNNMKNDELYVLDVCATCSRENMCDYPCEDAYNEFKTLNSKNSLSSRISQAYNQPVARVSEDDTYDKTTHSCCCEGNDINNYNIEDVLIYDVSDPSYLQIINGLRTPSDAINFRLLLEYMTEQNEEYTKENNLCLTCHSELEERKESRGEHFGTPSYERILICPRCG